MKNLRPLHLAGWKAFLLALFCLAFAGCQSVPPPPGYIAAGSGTAAGRIEFPRDLSTEARYALLRWYLDGQGEVVDRWAAPSLAVAQNASVSLARTLRLERYAVLQHKYPIFIDLRESDGTMGFNAKALADRRDWERLEVMLAEIRQVLSESQWMDVPTEAAAAYLEQDRRAAAALSFRRWAASNARIGIPHMPERDAFLKHLETIRASLREKRAVCRLMETAETLASPRYATIMPSAMPTVMNRALSMTSGTIRLMRSRFE